jgi:hypothetical protein
MEMRQEEAAGEGSQLLGDSRPEHEPGITDREAEVGPRKKIAVEPGDVRGAAVGAAIVRRLHRGITCVTE